MKTITIDRKKWLRGQDESGRTNKLWDKSRKAGCCLGHVIHQTSKLSWKKLDGEYDPQCVMKKDSLLTYMFDGGVENNDLALEAMEINDNHFINDKLREKRLIKLFEKHNIKLVFKNGRCPAGRGKRLENA